MIDAEQKLISIVPAEQNSIGRDEECRFNSFLVEICLISLEFGTIAILESTPNELRRYLIQPTTNLSNGNLQHP